MDETKQDKRTLTEVLNKQKIKMPLFLHLLFLMGLVFTFLALAYFIFGGAIVYKNGDSEEVYSWSYLINNNYVTLGFVIGLGALFFFGIFFLLFGSYIFTKSQFYSALRARTRKIINDNGAKWAGIIVIILGILMLYQGFTLMRALPLQLHERFPDDFPYYVDDFEIAHVKLFVTWGPKLTMIYGLIVALISSVPLIYSFVLKIIIARSDNKEEEVNYFFSRKTDTKGTI